MGLILKQKFCFDVNGRLETTWMVTLCSSPQLQWHPWRLKRCGLKQLSNMYPMIFCIGWFFLGSGQYYRRPRYVIISLINLLIVQIIYKYLLGYIYTVVHKYVRYWFSSPSINKHEKTCQVSHDTNLVLGVVDVHLGQFNHVELLEGEGVLGVVDVPVSGVNSYRMQSLWSSGSYNLSSVV